MGKPAPGKPRGTKPPVPAEPSGFQSLPAERESGEAMDLPLPRGHAAQLPEQVNRATEVAAAGSVSENPRDAAEAPGQARELLRDPGALWRSRGRQWEHSDADQPWSRVSKSPLPAPEGQADGGYQRRIHRCSHG